MEGVPGKIEKGDNDLEILFKIFPAKAEAELLQMMRGLRPVAEITIMPEFGDKMRSAIEAMKSHGLKTAERQREDGIYHFFISKEQELADEAVRALNEKDHARFGELMGFPRESVRAFVEEKEQIMSDEDVERALGFRNYVFPFKIARSGMQEAVDYLKQSYRLALEEAPHLFDKMLPSDIDTTEFKEKVSRVVYGVKEE